MNSISISDQEINNLQRWPWQAGTVLLKQPTVQKQVNDLRLIVHCDTVTFQAMYGIPLERLAEYLQGLPRYDESDREISIANGRLLPEVLGQILKTQQRRQGQLIPKNSEPELIAEQAARWTYALFLSSASLILAEVQAYFKMVIYLTEDKLTHYSFSPRASQLTDPSESPSSLAAQLSTPIGIAWLQAYPDGYACYQESLGEVVSLPYANPLKPSLPSRRHSLIHAVTS